MIGAAEKLMNPHLFQSLRDRFGNVKLMNQGIPMECRIAPDPTTDQDRMNIEIRQWGEGYKVCCPYCGDRKYRLIINHRWNTVDPTTGMYFGALMIKCFNDGCPGEFKGFADELKTYLHKHKAQEIPLIASSSIDMTSVAKSPGRCVTLSSLQSDGEVHTYLRSRKGGGFDPYELEKKYQVCYCVEGAEEFPIMTGRIVLPIYYSGILVGWQGRVPCDGVDPKYYTMPGFPKSRVLFNSDNATKKPLVILAEGVFDVYRIGDCGVCVFGHSLSHFQARRLFNTWGGGAMAVMFDSQDQDAQAKAQEFVQRSREQEAFAGGVANIVLPKDDPADMTEKDLWAEIYKQCTEQGVKIPF